jgi:probable HAF family extracellular repeat protein
MLPQFPIHDFDRLSMSMDIHIFNRATLCAALLLCAASFTRADYYYVKDLGTLGGNTSNANALNNLGQVVGLASTNSLGVSHAVLFSGTGSNNINLDVLGGNTFNSEAKGINDSGQIVGEGTAVGGGRIDAILYKASGNMDLGDLCDTDSAGSAEAINNSGTVVGFADTCSFTDEPCRYSGTGSGNTALPGIGGGVNGVAYGINTPGQSVGYVTRLDAAQHATLFSNSGGSTVDLGTLGGFTSHAYGINDAGQIVGDSLTTGNAAFHATFFSGTGTNNIDLGDLGGNNSHAYAINNSGEIVGNSYPATNNNSVYHAFIYKNGVMTDINGLVLPGSGFSNIRLVENGSRIPGRVINDSGQIAAVGDIGGRTHAVLLTPVLRKVSATRNGNDITVAFDALAGKT